MSDVLERAHAHLRTMAPHVRERLTAQLLQKVLAHAKELEESLRYVEAYLESAAESEDEVGLLMSAKPLLDDVRRFMRSNGVGQAAAEGGRACTGMLGAVRPGKD